MSGGLAFDYEFSLAPACRTFVADLNESRWAGFVRHGPTVVVGILPQADGSLDDILLFLNVLVVFVVAAGQHGLKMSERFGRISWRAGKMTMATLQKSDFGTMQTENVQENLCRERAQAILRLEIDFIPNQEFIARNQADALDQPDDPVVTAIISLSKQTTAPTEIPSHLRGFCETELLTHEQEAALFREMNYAKYRANVARTSLDPDHRDIEAVEAIEGLLERAQAIRDHLVKANTRLVMATVKKFVTPQQSFDDLLSEGTLTLMHAVEKFDYDRGFRFSTYAYRSIARSAYRAVSDARKDESRYTRDADEWAFEQEDAQGTSLATEQAWSNLRELTKTMLAKLDPRERLIIRSRYALGAHRKVRTFQDLANRLGVSKERVRQLEQRAVSKLSAMAAEFDMDDLFAASMV